jgi:glycosyltransferase involved in cell wall biosynthesis
MDTLPISAFIIAHNEADRIGPAIGSLRGLADEIVVVDSGSTDGTQALCEKLGARVVHSDWPGYGLQKRFAEDQCRHDWLLNIDADERLTPELAAEIRTLFRGGAPSAPGCALRIVNLYRHEAGPAPLAFSLAPVRLYDRRRGRYSDNLVHDRVGFLAPEDAGKVLRLAHPVLHYSMRSLSAWVAKMNAYSDLQVAEMAGRGRRPGFWRLYVEFQLGFLKAFILRREILRGRWGLIAAVTYGYGRFLRLAKAYEHQLPDRSAETVEKPE